MAVTGDQIHLRFAERTKESGFSSPKPGWVGVILYLPFRVFLI